MAISQATKDSLAAAYYSGDINAVNNILASGNISASDLQQSFGFSPAEMGLLSGAGITPAAAPVAAPVTTPVVTPVTTPVVTPAPVAAPAYDFSAYEAASAGPVAPPAFALGSTNIPSIEQRVVPVGDMERVGSFIRGTDIELEPQRTETFLNENDSRVDLTGYTVYDPEKQGVHQYSPTGQYLGFTSAPRETNIFKDVATQALPAFLPALTAGLASPLGSVIAPSLSTAAQLGLGTGAITGAGTLLTGGSVEDALRNAVLTGGLAYGGSTLFGGGDTGTAGLTDRQLAIADAAQLAEAGLSQAQIADVLGASGFNEAIVNRALSSLGPAAVDPNTVMVTAPRLPNVSPAIAATAGTVGGLLSSPAVATPVTPLAPDTSTVEIVGERPSSPPVVIPPATVAPGLLTPPAVTPTTPPSTLPGTGETVEVVAEKPKTPTFPVITETPTISPITGTAPIDIPKIVAENPNITVSDLLKIFTALTTLGAGAAAGSRNRGNVPFVAPTQGVPQPSSDYYNAIQQYYNAYLPSTPRDVATPLQQWYESKFGA